MSDHHERRERVRGHRAVSSTATVPLSLSPVPQSFASSFFSEFQAFNKIQSRVLTDCLYSDESLVVATPTGSGKTTFFDLVRHTLCDCWFILIVSTDVFCSHLVNRDRVSLAFSLARSLAHSINQQAMCRFLTLQQPGQIIYICPTKSLAEERAADWTRKVRMDTYQR